MILGQRNRLNPELTDHTFPSNVYVPRFIAVEAVKIEPVRTSHAFDSGHPLQSLHCYRTTNPSSSPCCRLSSNESVGKAQLGSEHKIWGDLTLPKPEIVDCRAFREVFFPHISHKCLFADFSCRINALGVSRRASKRTNSCNVAFDRLSRLPQINSPLSVQPKLR